MINKYKNKIQKVHTIFLFSFFLLLSKYFYLINKKFFSINESLTYRYKVLKTSKKIIF